MLKKLYSFINERIEQTNKNMMDVSSDPYFDKRIYDAQKLCYHDIKKYIEDNYPLSEYQNNKITVYNFPGMTGIFSEQMNLLYPEMNIPLMDLYDKLVDIISDFFNDYNQKNMINNSFKIATTSYCVICAIVDIADEKGYDIEFINKDGTITTNSEDIFKQFKRFYDLLQKKKYD